MNYTTYTYKGVRYSVEYAAFGKYLPASLGYPEEFPIVVIINWFPKYPVDNKIVLEDGEKLYEFHSLSEFDKFLVESHCLSEYLSGE